MRLTDIPANYPLERLIRVDFRGFSYFVEAKICLCARSTARPPWTFDPALPKDLKLLDLARCQTRHPPELSCDHDQS